MPKPTKGPRLGAGPAHERLMLAGLATSLFEHKRITTTLAKAKRLRPYAERLITFGKRGDLHARRRVMRVIRDKSVVHVLFTEIAEAMAERPGGYTRITKIGPRQGDGAPMAVIELVMEPVTPKKKRTPPPTKPKAKPKTTDDDGADASADGLASEELAKEDSDAPADEADDAKAPAGEADDAKAPASEADDADDK